VEPWRATGHFADADATVRAIRGGGRTRPVGALGHPCGPGDLRSIMRGLGLVACHPRPFRPVMTIAGDAGTLPDLVAGDFAADRPGGEAGRRHHLHSRRGQLVVSGDGPGLFLQESCRICDGRPPVDGTCRGCAATSSRYNSAFTAHSHP
jgi:hypothetical protein